MAWLLKPRQASTDSRPAQPHTGQLLGAPPPTAAHGGPPAQSLLCTLASPSRREPTEILADLTGWNVWDLINEANVTVSGLRAVSWQGGMGCATAHISSSICRLAATAAESWLGERGRSSLPSNPTLRCSCSQLWQAACLVQGTPLHCCPGSRASPSGASTHSAPLLPPAQAAYLVQGINSLKCIPGSRASLAVATPPPTPPLCCLLFRPPTWCKASTPPSPPCPATWRCSPTTSRRWPPTSGKREPRAPNWARSAHAICTTNPSLEAESQLLTSRADLQLQPLSTHTSPPCSMLEEALSHERFHPVYLSAKQYACCDVLNWLGGLWLGEWTKQAGCS